jgi:hypothetical protein
MDSDLLQIFLNHRGHAFAVPEPGIGDDQKTTAFLLWQVYRSQPEAVALLLSKQHQVNRRQL